MIDGCLGLMGWLEVARVPWDGWRLPGSHGMVGDYPSPMGWLEINRVTWDGWRLPGSHGMVGDYLGHITIISMYVSIKRLTSSATLGLS